MTSDRERSSIAPPLDLRADAENRGADAETPGGGSDGAPPASEASRCDEAQREPGGRARVLIVEDNVDSAESLSRLLELFGHEVDAVHDGDAALAAARDRRPDVMLIDIGLPGRDGYDVARSVRADPLLKHVTLVALTGYGQDDDITRATEAGFDFHHLKPIDPRELDGIIARAGEGRKESATVH
jgi:CheY-like chemotaxis protein